ncbi:MAG: glycerol-3-phosphate dehydrogenase [Gammaproteobacteria bacterium RIFCSPHIGHO2_12_FULL_45_9]|nr:MAG: glycerol-3-phosphate dehydrogenase [Gammaproteobacteria bacterium RIFCSPHIGHO2_12_FULL_45_9]
MEGISVKPIAVLGAGSWGTALALYLSRQGQAIRLWSIETPHIKTMMAEKTNNQYIPGHPFPDILHPTPDLAETVSDVDYILIVVPSDGFQSTLSALKPLLKPHTSIICASKGLDASGKLLHEVAHDVLGGTHPYAVLSGPSFAHEVAAGLPTGVVIASNNTQLCHTLKQKFNSPLFQIDLSDDLVGVEVCGIAKNVIAIATGVADGMELGANARSTIITRGLAELTRLGLKLGGRMETFVGLAGMGDLILTCSDNQSRNRRLGLAIGKGQKMANAERDIGQAIEGKKNAQLVVQLARQHKINMPICEAVWDILQGKVVTKKDAMERLLAKVA